MGSIKSGWLQKLSGFFKNSWKRRYFVLYSDGQFCYFQSPDDRERDGQIHMKTECRRIDVGPQVDVKPPKSGDLNAVFSVASPERTWYLVAESAAECREWVKVLEDARTPMAYSGTPSVMPAHPYPNPVGPPPPYSQGMPQPSQVPNTVPYPQQGPGQMPPYPPQPPMPYAQAPQAPYPPAGPQPQHPSYPPTNYPPPQQQPYPYQGYPPTQPGYGMPSQYPPQMHRPGTTATNYPPQPHYQPQAHYPGTTTTYVQQPTQKGHSSGGGKKLLMGAAAGALGGAAMGYMMGNALGGFGHRGYGGWDSDHSWSSGGSFDCDFD